ncbi:Propanediol utilization protein PduU [Pelotomaculum schinkii]|uniref:Propanediol utilization protein PduU n=1 Tax=Pelotomaculum schinkii TaxID=78350 RepID=A0A4Y7R9N0_9FIRM|nr:BMC domain-containing protein [Pelotomaculum schinkii]TEB05419.1 Propanediol utilization protein PduU [Pelotomaculum schinkii]
MVDDKFRIISEDVPGREVSLCHLIANPDIKLTEMLGLQKTAFAILSVTPSEVAYIAADRITKMAPVELVFADRYLGTLMVAGQVSALETVLEETVSFLHITLGIEIVPITRS